MTHSLYVAQKTKDAIVDQFRERAGRRPDVDLATPTLKVHVHITADQAEVSLDSSGESLHKRGYRRQGGEAPLNETLAAGLVLLSGWDKKKPFVDLMCGSGTLVIEAALIAMNIAPGLFRRQFGFERWKDFNASAWEQLKEDARKSVPSDPADLKITGIDLSSFAIRAAKENAEAAGVEKVIHFLNQSFEDYDPLDGDGIIVTNPPYGERIRPDDLFSLYKMVGDILKHKFSGWKAFIFTANKEASKHIGLRPSGKTQLYNGQLECRLLRFEMYPGSKKTKSKEVNETNN
jgi:putative N6-adenine-specific DNA methylase